MVKPGLGDFLLTGFFNGGKTYLVPFLTLKFIGRMGWVVSSLSGSWINSLGCGRSAYNDVRKA